MRLAEFTVIQTQPHFSEHLHWWRNNALVYSTKEEGN